MVFRDDLRAAQEKIEALEQTLREHEARAKHEKNRLHAQIEDLEEQLGRAKMVPSSEIWAACWMPAVAVLALYGGAFYLAVRGEDALAWAAVQISIVTGILGTSWSWGRRGKLWSWCGTFLAKMIIVTVWAWGWWHPIYERMSTPFPSAAVYFFWAAPLVIFVFVLVEGISIRMSLRPVEHSPNPPES